MRSLKEKNVVSEIATSGVGWRLNQRNSPRLEDGKQDGTFLDRAAKICTFSLIRVRN